MVTEEGIITSTTSSTAWVKTVRSKACEACEARDSCHTSETKRDVFVQVPNTINAKAGDRVVLGFESAPLLKLTFMLYIFPILLLITGAVIGQNLAPHLNTDESLTACLTGFLFFGISFIILRTSSRFLSQKKEYKPFLIRISRKTTPSCNQ